MSRDIFQLPDTILVLSLWEWLSQLEYVVLLTSLGRKETNRVNCLQEKYSDRFRKFLLNDKTTVLASSLWNPIFRNTLTCKDSVKDTVFQVDLAVCLLADRNRSICERYLSVVRKFEKVRFKVLSWVHSHSFVVSKFAENLMKYSHIKSLDISGIAINGLVTVLALLTNLNTLAIECPNRKILQLIVVHGRNLECLTLRGQYLSTKALNIFGFHVHKLKDFSTNARNYSNVALCVFLHHGGSGLKSLKLDRMRIINESFSVGLAGVCSIEHLALSLCDNIGDLTVILNQMPKLQVISCCGNNNVTHSELVIILVRCVNIRELHFESIKPSLKQNMSFYMSCSNLTSVRLSNCNLSDEILSSLVTDKTGSQFTTLDISKNPDLSDRALYDAVYCLYRVTNLNLSGCSRMTGTVTEIMSVVCFELTTLNVSECPRVTEKGIIGVLKGCTCLTTLLMEYLINCNTLRVIDYIVENNYKLKKIRASNGTNETNESLVTRLQESIPSVDAFIRPSAAVETFAVFEKISFEPPISVVVEKIDFCDDEFTDSVDEFVDSVDESVDSVDEFVDEK